MKPAVADAALACAERLLADGKKAEATDVYRSLSGENQPKQFAWRRCAAYWPWPERRIKRVDRCKNRNRLVGIVRLAGDGRGFGGWLRRPDEPNDELVQMIVNLLNDKDRDMRAMGFQQVREAAKGPAATKRFAALLADAAARRPGRIARRPGRSGRQRRPGRLF